MIRDHGLQSSALSPQTRLVEGRSGGLEGARSDRPDALDPFAELPPADLARLMEGARERHLAAGEALWFAGETADHFAVIRSGIVEIRQMTPTGEGVVVGLFRTGESIGLGAALERAAFPADAIPIGGAVEVLWIRGEALREALESSMAVARAVNQALLRHTSALRAKINIVSAGSVPRRLAVLMRYLIERFGHTTEAGTVIVEAPLGRDEISQLVSARVETVIRILSRWQKAGWLASRPGVIEIVRPDMLQRIVDT